MELWIDNQYSEQREVVEVGEDRVCIGRDESNDVVLRSPFVSREHARIFRRDGAYFVESLGLNETIVASVPLPARRQRKIEFGDEIRIGEYSLYLMEPAARRVGAGAAAATPRKRIIDLEQRLHAKLLERLNLRVTGQAGRAEEQHVRLINRRLFELVQEHLEEIDEEMARTLVREYLWRSAVTELTRRASGKLMYGYGFEHTEVREARFEQLLETLVGDLLSSRPLRLRPHTVKDDLARIEADWPVLAGEALERMDDHLRRYVCHRMLAKEIEDVVLGYGPLQDLLEMPNVNEIMVVGPDRIYVEKDGAVQNTARSFFSEQILLSIIERIITPIGRRIDRSSPVVDARLPDGSRVNAVTRPLSLSGPVLTIRKFAQIPFTIDDLIERDTLTAAAAEFLQACVQGRKNLIITGGTASGKTTTLNVLAASIGPEERIITIEDSAELQLPQEHLVRLETRPANVEGRGAYTIRELVKNALRMRPDRLIVGECRGAEALDMLQAMNTGHDGSMTTIHANTPEDTLTRLETMVLMAVEMPMRAIREQVVAALDVIVQMSRLAGGRRRITHISQITGLDPQTTRPIVEDIFVLRGGPGGRLRHTGFLPAFSEDLIDAGLLDVGVFS